MALDVSNFVDTLSNSASTAKAAAQTQSSLVATGVKDSMVAVDGYGKTTANVLSNMKNTLLGKLSDTKNYLLNTKISDLGSLNDLLTQASQVKQDASAFTAQLSSEIGQSISTVKGISDEVINGATSTLQEINNTVDSTFNDINGGVYQLNSAGDILGANNLINSVKTLLDSAEYTFQNLEDKLSITALKSSILQQAAYLGLSNVVSSVYSSDSSNPTLTAAMGDSLPTVLASGNLTLVKTMVESLGGTYILQKAPDAVQQVLQNYKFGKVVDANSYSSYATELVTVLAMIDPRWNSSQFTPAGHRLDVFRSISSNAKTVLNTLPEYAYQIAVVQHYSDNDILTLAKQQYSYIALA
ncbi:hypothetical protein [Klebsiella pneumoniae]|uniref:hypothetical protein n=1 Tax=Klebsiella pneumoniae TaxID=573 RepID=UPI000D1ABE8A|nr:hypothetical protein [Klebsiella pneumoniae]